MEEMLVVTGFAIFLAYIPLPLWCPCRHTPAKSDLGVGHPVRNICFLFIYSKNPVTFWISLLRDIWAHQ